MEGKLGRRINELINREEWKELEDLLLNTEDEWVIEILKRRLCGADGTKWVAGHLSALTCGTRESTSLRLKIYEAVLKEARNEVAINERAAGELVGVLMVHVDAFTTQAVVDLVDQYVEYVRSGAPLQGRWVDLLAKLVTSVSQKEGVSISGREMAGDDYRYQVLKALCDLPWSAETTTSLLPVFNDMDLPKEELRDVIFKVERVLRDVDYQSVPPIIYHLILLVLDKLPGRVLQLVTDYFNKQELEVSKSSEAKETNSTDIDIEAIDDGKYNELTEAKGTVILHVTHHAQFNPALVRDYLKFIKSSTWLMERLITPFNLALSLSLTSIEKFQQQILDAIKSCLLKGFRQEECRRKSQWLRETWGEECDIMAVFRTTVDNCIMGWDQVSQGLVQLSFVLLESRGGPKGETYASRRAVELASTVLPLVVRKQTHLVRPVVSQLANFILTSSSAANYIKILGSLAKSLPHLLMDHLNLIRQPLDYLEFLSLQDASLFFHALLPLLKMSMTLKDAVMITLRKMLFSKKVERRQIAVRGFLQFLRHFRVMGTLPSSQASTSMTSSLSAFSTCADVHSAFNSSTNEALSLELLGVLRRCFSQQHQVRSTLYSGLYDVCRANPRLTPSVLEMLLRQGRSFVDARPDTLNPVALKSVVAVRGDAATLVEPLGELLSALASCAAHYEASREDADDDEGGDELLEEVGSLFDVLTEKLSACDPEDLGVDPRGDFTTGAAGQKNVLCATVMVGVYDALMQRAFARGPSDDAAREVLSLFKSRRKVVELVREKGGKPAKKEGRKGKAGVCLKTSLSLGVAAGMLGSSLDPEGPLGASDELQTHLLTVVEGALASLGAMTPSERDAALVPLRGVARALLRECSDELGAGDASDERRVARLGLGVRVLDALLAAFVRFHGGRLEAALRDVLGREDDRGRDALLYKVTRRCQRALVRILHHGERDALLGDARVLVRAVATCAGEMAPSSAEVRSVQQWLLQLCRDEDLAHRGLAEASTELLLALTDQTRADDNLTRAVARDLHRRLGDLEQGVEVEGAGRYAMVTEAAAPAVLAAVLAHLEGSLALVRLALNKTRACVASGARFDPGAVEGRVSARLGSALAAFGEVVQSALPQGPGTDRTLGAVAKLYGVLTLYVRSHLDLHRADGRGQISGKFEGVVRASGEGVTAAVYPLITYVEGAQRRAGGRRASAAASRALKESRLIPSVVFAVEEYEKHLIALSRRAKVNLMTAMRPSTARDFRIVPAALMEAVQEKEDDDEEEDGGGQGSEDEGRERAAPPDKDRNDKKRRKTRENKKESSEPKKKKKKEEDDEEEDEEGGRGSEDEGRERAASPDGSDKKRRKKEKKESSEPKKKKKKEEEEEEEEEDEEGGGESEDEGRERGTQYDKDGNDKKRKKRERENKNEEGDSEEEGKHVKDGNDKKKRKKQ